MIKLTNITVSLKASTWEELEKLQLMNHLINGVHYNYYQCILEEDGYRLLFFADRDSWKDPTNLPEDELLNHGVVDV